MAYRHPLATPVKYVKGVGPALAAKLARMGIFTVGDLLSVVPIRYIDRRKILPIEKLTDGRERVIIGEIVRRGVAFLGRNHKRIYEVIVKDDTGSLSAKWFNFNQRYFDQRYKVGSKVLLFGDVSVFQMIPQFVHPEVETITEGGEADAARIVPVYPLTEGLYQKTMRKIIRNAWDTYNFAIKPVFPDSMIEKFELADPWSCLQELHFPSSDADVDVLNNGQSKAHTTLIFDEFFFLELGLAMRRKKILSEDGIAFDINSREYLNFINSLPFELTKSQRLVLDEIKADMARARPMNRLLQGDVGSGKTVVALASAWHAIASGYQVAIMAPTEILAEQHHSTINSLAMTNIALLTSNTKGSERENIYKGLSDGNINIVVGTHALIQETVQFKKLGFIVVDEQHRFGVLQRAAITKKVDSSYKPDLLIMTATPIPRTLALTLYGDLDISVIDELPPGRKPVITRLYSESQREKLYNGMRMELSNGRQIYVVYPLIEESEKVDLKNATDMKEEIASIFEPDFRVSLLHGKMKGEDKENIMNRFKKGEIKILVTTSVVEVGVDVPNASVMVVEHSERFGLSQLHQLRGRVGRSQHQSYCILVADYQRSEEAKRRLAVMVESTDGFKIAEEDLAIRGPGEFIGTRQSGLPPFRVANLGRDIKILSKAREAAFKLIEEDPNLMKPEYDKLKDTLQARWAGKLELAMVS